MPDDSSDRPTPAKPVPSLPRRLCRFVGRTALVLGVVVACAFLAIEATEPLAEPEACAACHEMSDVYASWAQSPHHTNPSGVKVTCIACHLPPREEFVSHLAAKGWSGTKDVSVHLFGDYDAEAARRTVRQNMPNQRCLHCHDNLPGKPKSSAVSVVHDMAVADAGERIYACVVCHDSLHGPKKPPVAVKAVEYKPQDNSYCHVCHDNFVKEEFAETHRLAGLGCVACHGESFAHADDEEHVTAPLVMYPKDKINASCTTAECHPETRMKALDPHRPFYASPEQHESRGITCASCHGKHRIVERKHSRWDKATGKLIWKDGYVVTDEERKRLIESIKADGMGGM